MQVVLTDMGGEEYKYQTGVSVKGEWTGKEGTKLTGYYFNPPLDIWSAIELDTITLAPGSKREVVLNTSPPYYLLSCDQILSTSFEGKAP